MSVPTLSVGTFLVFVGVRVSAAVERLNAFLAVLSPCSDDVAVGVTVDDDVTMAADGEAFVLIPPVAINWIDLILMVHHGEYITELPSYPHW